MFLSSSSAWSSYHDAITELLGGEGRLYLSPNRCNAVSIKGLVRKYFRVPEEEEDKEGSKKERPIGTRWRKEARGEVEKEEDEEEWDGGREGERDRLDAAFLALRELSKAWHAIEMHVLPLMRKEGRREGGEKQVGRGSSTTTNNSNISASNDDSERSSSSSSSRSSSRSRSTSTTTSSSSSFNAVKLVKRVGPGVILLAHPMMVCDFPLSLPSSLFPSFPPTLPPSPFLKQ